MLSLLFSRAGAIILGAVAALVFAVWAITTAYQAGRDAERTAALTNSVEILRERSATNDKIKGMDDRELCIALGGLPDECAGLGL